jgi:hypothetical protein
LDEEFPTFRRAVVPLSSGPCNLRIVKLDVARALVAYFQPKVTGSSTYKRFLLDRKCRMTDYSKNRFIKTIFKCDIPL